MDLDIHIDDDMEEMIKQETFLDIENYYDNNICQKINNTNSINDTSNEDCYTDETEDEDYCNDLNKLFRMEIKKTKCYKIDEERMNEIIHQQNEHFWERTTTFNFEKYYNQLMKQPQIELVLSKCGKYLKELILSGSSCDSSILPVIKKYCRKLVTLDIEIEFNHQSDYFDFCINMKHLKNIKFSTNFWYKNRRIDTESIIIDSIPKKNKILSMDFSHCIFNSSINSITNFSNLTYLDISYVDAVNDNVLMNLQQKSININNLNIEGCKKITNLGLQYLCKLKNLEKLNISFNNNITDELFPHFVFLKKLCCGCCKNIQNDGISNLITNLIPSGFNHLEIYQTSIDVNLLIYAHRFITINIPNKLVKIIASGLLKNDYEKAIEQELWSTNKLLIQWTGQLFDYPNDNIIQFHKKHGEDVKIKKTRNENIFVNVMN